MFLTSTHTPLQKISDPVLDAFGVNLYVKREDLIHPLVSGNKWRKLKYNLLQAKAEGKDTLLSFGGAFSNHIYALAAAGKEFGFKTIGVIRGKDASEDNPTLSFAKSCGMQLYMIDRDQYKKKDNPVFIEEMKERFHGPYVIPEGGSNVYAVRGCAEIIEEINIDFDYVCSPCGTGATLAGLITGLGGKKRALGFSVLKGENLLTSEVKKLLNEFEGRSYDNWDIRTDYHFGGYAKSAQELQSFIGRVEKLHQIIYEPVYTGKMMYGIYDLINKSYFKPGETIVAIHTGGLQGLEGLKLKNKDL
jgi:1-aminocyclopropane-1-carboxylate deaminase